MSYEELIKKPFVPSLLFGVYVALESYLLSNLIFLVLPKFWTYRALVEDSVAVVVACAVADFVFNRLALRLRKKIIIAAAVVAATLLMEAVILAAFYYFG